MSDLLHSAGFLGTNANWGADMTLLVSLLVAAIFTYGGYLAKKAQGIEKKYTKDDPEYAQAGKLFTTHRWVQTAGAVLNIILVFWLMLLPYRDFIVQDKGGPRTPIFYTVTMIHALIGVFAFTFGNFVVLRGNNLMIPALKFNNYKPYMRTAYVAYMLTTALGVWVYVTWFITISNTPTFK